MLKIKTSGLAIAISVLLLMVGCSDSDLNTQLDAYRDNPDTTNKSEQTLRSQLEDSSQSEIDQKLLDASVVRVVDGDTVIIKVNGKEERVRMLCVDTPESVSPNVEPQPFGKEASDFTKKMLPAGKSIKVETGLGDGRDKYGRLLVYLYVDGKMFNETLLEKGLARVAYVYSPNTKYVDRFYEIQKKAQANEIGIWSVENYATDKGFNLEAYKKQMNQSPSISEATSSCTIKGNINGSSRIYHISGQQNYDVTKAEEMFCTEKEAQEAGFKKAKQ